MLDRQRHEQLLKNILRDIYTTPELQARLAFKGGTCMYLFYGLDRFSVDLDFNLVASDFSANLLDDIVKKYLTVDDQMNKHFTWLWVGSYEKGKQRIKIEVSKRDYPDTYIPKDFYGLTISTMSPDCMFAHKLCAITDRKKLQNRDLYDAHFMFVKQFSINEEIIKLRTGQTLKEYFRTLIECIDKNVKQGTILEGLGELLTDPQKDHVKSTLLRDLLFDLRSRIE